ncbi:hypothetical protein TNCV_3666491 [Trichonephila clavipes]|nr:hypothetical protein TNCV_3666491 [Trichonephila clavipes]
MLQHQGEDPTGKARTPLICSTNPTAVLSSETPKRGTTSRLTGAGSPCLPSTAKRGPKVIPGHHFPPYVTPHTANMRVGKPTVLVKNK